MTDNVNRLVDTMKVKGGFMPIEAYIKKYGGADFIRHVGRVPSLKGFHLSECATGVYFLLQGKKVVYIGQTKNIKSRLQAHKEDRSKVFDNVRFIDGVPVDLLDAVEAYYINKVKPKYNVSLPMSGGVNS